MGQKTWPSYLSLPLDEIQRRADIAVNGLKSCKVCPWDCEVDRSQPAPPSDTPKKGKQPICRTWRRAWVGSHFAHFGEEDCLRGWRGSGTIFFSWCNLRCVFCQNCDLSQDGAGKAVEPEELAAMMLDLQAQCCHNINFVTPEHVVPQILEALPIAIAAGLRLPIVYNTSGYDSMESLQLMDGIVDIYLPDFKYWDPAMAKRYTKAKTYPSVTKQVIKEMHRQVGPLQIDPKTGLAVRGLLVRHLVMPEHTAGTREIMRFLMQEISPETYVNIMDQYRPEHKAERYVEINKRTSSEEMVEALEMARQEGVGRIDSRKDSNMPRFF